MSSWIAVGKPTTPGSFRGLYFATHFGNVFANAPPRLIHEYLEDMALWGANTLVLISEAAKFHNLTALMPLLDRNAKIGAYAQSIGFKVGWIFNNEGFQSAYTRDPTTGAWTSNISFTRPTAEGGDFGTETAPQFLICPAKGLSYLRDEVWGPILRRVAANGLHLDHLIAWPYDWGGCGCEHDWPWGSVGFPRYSTEILAKAKSEFGHPNVEGTLSTWHFQLSQSKPPADEYGGLDKWLRTQQQAGHVARGGGGEYTYTGGYGGLGYSYGIYGRLRQGRLSAVTAVPEGPRGRRAGDTVHHHLSAATAPHTQSSLPSAWMGTRGDVKWSHAMSAVPGGFDWLQKHGPVGGLPTLDFPEYSVSKRAFSPGPGICLSVCLHLII